jgi:creatinine amidohydrolase
VSGGVFLGELTWRDAEAALAAKLVVIPFAAGAKEHGPHLPLNTDQVVMEHLLAEAVSQCNVVVAPPILHGWFPAFRGYPGTEVNDPTVFLSYVKVVAESLIAHGARRLVFLNAGITNATGLPITMVARDLHADRGVPTLVVSWDDLETDEVLALYEQERGGHADEGETSIMLYLRPDLVDMSKAVKDYRQPPREQIGYAPGTFDRAHEAGHFGDPTLASAEKGKRLLAIMRKNWLTALDQFADAGN